MPALLMKDFKNGATDRVLFSKNPRLTLRQAFRAITQDLPERTTVIFDPYKNGIVPDIYPFCGPEAAIGDSGEEPTHLSCQFFPQFRSLLLLRIRVSEERQKGIGTALIATQQAFWRQMGITAIAVKTHGMSEGFYRKLGFERVAALPECPCHDGSILTLMRLDLADSGQNATFMKALSKARRWPGLTPSDPD